MALQWVGVDDSVDPPLWRAMRAATSWSLTKSFEELIDLLGVFFHRFSCIYFNDWYVMIFHYGDHFCFSH